MNRLFAGIHPMTPRRLPERGCVGATSRSASEQDPAISPSSTLRSRNPHAFTLVEMLVVLAIIGLVLAVTIPSFRHMNEGRAMDSAAQQLMQDIAFARQNAISSRGTVAVVFLPEDIRTVNPTAWPAGNERSNVTTLQAGGLTTYAIFSFRQVGEQPGQNNFRYITPWKTLPEKTFIAQYGFTNLYVGQFPFPLAESAFTALPYIAFNSQGECKPIVQGSATPGIPVAGTGVDVNIPLAKGSIMYTRDSSGAIATWDVQEIPPGSSVSLSNVVHIDWLTGRAKLERADLTKQ